MLQNQNKQHQQQQQQQQQQPPRQQQQRPPWHAAHVAATDNGSGNMFAGSFGGGDDNRGFAGFDLELTQSRATFNAGFGSFSQHQHMQQQQHGFQSMQHIKSESMEQIVTPTFEMDELIIKSCICILALSYILVQYPNALIR